MPSVPVHLRHLIGSLTRRDLFRSCRVLTELGALSPPASSPEETLHEWRGLQRSSRGTARQDGRMG
jgi:hypothetical protein